MQLNYLNVDLHVSSRLAWLAAARPLFKPRVCVAREVKGVI